MIKCTATCNAHYFVGPGQPVFIYFMWHWELCKVLFFRYSPVLNIDRGWTLLLRFVLATKSWVHILSYLEIQDLDLRQETGIFFKEDQASSQSSQSNAGKSQIIRHCKISAYVAIAFYARMRSDQFWNIYVIIARFFCGFALFQALRIMWEFII
jgi:hypothetical protein